MKKVNNKQWIMQTPINNNGLLTDPQGGSSLLKYINYN